jgi:hypothetical protein
MNRDEAKIFLLLYRSSADADDPQVATGLAFMKSDAALREWFEDYCAQQKTLSEKLRQISAPPGLKEQIISEQQALAKKTSRRQKIVATVALAAIVASLAVIATFYFPITRRPVSPATGSLADYEIAMVYRAIGGYGMNLSTNDMTQIRAYLAKNQCPSDFTVPAPLEKTAATGCAISSWENVKVSMICFSTGRPLPPSQPGDLWLFVMPGNVITNAPDTAAPQLAEVSGVSVAAWTQDGKFYLLATPGGKHAVQKYL